MATGEVAMGRAVAVRADYTAGEVRRLAKRAKDAAQARRLLAIAAVLDGASRADAAKIGGMDRQTLRDWVIRFNEQGPDGLINVPAPGAPAKLNSRPLTSGIEGDWGFEGAPNKRKSFLSQARMRRKLWPTAERMTLAASPWRP